MAEYRKVAKISDVPPGEMIGIEIGENWVAISNVEGQFYAFDAECTHAAGWLYQGFLEGHNVQCPVHFAEFDVRTGEVMEPPAGLPIQTYPVRVQGEDVEIEYP